MAWCCFGTEKHSVKKPGVDLFMEHTKKELEKT
jgi:hypothetical protein